MLTVLLKYINLFNLNGNIKIFGKGYLAFSNSNNNSNSNSNSRYKKAIACVNDLIYIIYIVCVCVIRVN